MMSGGMLGYAGAVMFAAALVITSANVSALERTDGDFWLYSVTVNLAAVDPSELNITETTFDLSGIDLTGEMLYEYLGPDNISFDGTTHSVNVMAVSGYLDGDISLIGLRASQTIQGHVFETSEGQGTVRDDLTLWTNLTWGVGSFAYLMRYESRLINVYKPPLMSAFDPGSVVLGGSWSESVLVRTIVMNATTDEVVSDSNGTVSIQYVVAAETEEISTPAGRFSAFEVAAYEADGKKVVYWWSEEVGNFVAQETYLDNGSEPAETMSLKDYSNESATGILVFVSIGAVALAVAVAVLVLVLLRRRPRRGEPEPPVELLQLPPQ